MSRLKELREERGKLISDARSLNDLAVAEKREMTDEEAGKFDEMMDIALEKLDAKIKREERLQEEERRAAERVAPGPDDPAAPFVEPEQRHGPRATAEYREAYNHWLIGSAGQDEFRALSAGADTAGGYIVVPEQFMATLIKSLDDRVFMRANGNVLPPLTSAESLGVPTLDADPDDFDWTTELATGNEDSAMAFGKRALEPHPLAKRIKVSKKLLRIAALPAEAIVRERLEYKLGVTQEKAYLTGDGNQKPLGVFTASANGIPTSRDVSADNTTTSPTFDGLTNAKYSLKGGYWAAARWIFHRDVMKVIAKLKDGEGQYLWRLSVRDGEPDRILNFPFDMSEFSPNTLTTGLYVGIVGDFSNYWIVDALDMQMQRLIELYAETNQDGFIARYEGDGAPVLGEAFARVKLA